MGFRVRKSIKIAPGVRMNISNKSVGISTGVKGLRYSVNSSGRKTVTASIPGTGISYSQSVGGGKQYKSSAYQRNSQLHSSYDKLKQKEDQLEANRLEVELFENRLEMIKSIHIECDEPIDWNEIKNRPNPLGESGVGRNQKNAQLKLEGFKPSWIDKLFRREVKKIKALEQEVNKAILQDQEQYESWSRMVEVADKICEGDIDTYLEVIEEFRPLDDLLEFGSSFEFIVEDSKHVAVEFEIHTNEVVPKEVISLTKTGKISTKNMTKTKFYDILQDYVCSCTLRIARDIFALLPVEAVTIHALDERLDTEKGLYDLITILSIKIDRATLETLNMELIDPSDAMNNFEHNMTFKKTKGFEEIIKLK